jgi:hypothetical protein
VAITNGYATLAEIKTHLTISGSTDDDRLEAAVEQASRAIDAECRRVFYATTATRYFQAEAPDLLILGDDLLTVTTLKTDQDGDRTYETTWATTDYDLTPDNASPKSAIHLAPQGRYSFPTHRKGVEIAGSWGYNATGSYPDAISHACVILAARYFKRKDAPFGVLGTPELGFQRIPRTDTEVKQLLAPYRRLEVL